MVEEICNFLLRTDSRNLSLGLTLPQYWHWSWSNVGVLCEWVCRVAMSLRRCFGSLFTWPPNSPYASWITSNILIHSHFPPPLRILTDPHIIIVANCPPTFVLYRCELSTHLIIFVCVLCSTSLYWQQHVSSSSSWLTFALFTHTLASAMIAAKLLLAIIVLIWRYRQITATYALMILSVIVSRQFRPHCF